ncbi:hypothetical protein Pint_30787 [Pistacia integerrima]|uniref:Uncharacterized protein n=1 Tax=Pistacia integerrima TaxID=434235 RepID=A0ACC0WZB3_9ROSI|nr:hypothetical protein Pint_30787 [Pistacia integerrima]
MESLFVLDFLDKDIGDVEPVKPTSLKEAPFKPVEEVKDLKELAAKLRSVKEFALDNSSCKASIASSKSCTIDFPAIQLEVVGWKNCASNVVEKCLEYGDAAERELLIEEIVGQSEENGYLLIMMKDQFAVW